MDAKECIKRIIHVLGEQRYVFSKGLQLYCSNLDSLKQIEEKFVDPLNLNCFQGDMYSISQDLPDIVLYPWSYKAPRPILRSWLGETQGLLSVVGIMMISDLNQCDITAILNRFDNAMMNVLRKYPWGDENKVTFGTLLCIFSQTEDAQRFNMSMRNYYCSHVFKNTFVSTISIDCETEKLTQGRAGIFSHKWHGGIHIPKLKDGLFNRDEEVEFPRDIIEVTYSVCDELTLERTQNKNSKGNLIVSEMENAIGQIVSDVVFKYPADYLEYDGIVGLIGWSFPKGKSFIKGALEYLRKSFDVNNLVPFAIDDIGDGKEPTQYACFLIDGIKNDKVITVYPFGSKETFYQEEYDDINEWFNAERIDMTICNIMTLNGKPKCLGIDLIDNDACGPVVAIPKQLLDGYRLVMTTDAGSWYAENDDIKNVVEKYGFGLRVLSVREIENENVETIMETIDVIGEKPGIVCIEGVKANLPDNAYILATPFAGEFSVKLETEDSNGNRNFLWADDYIYK